MDAKDALNLNISPVCSTRDLADLASRTGNLYLSLAIISKRANQISRHLKEELHSKLAEFAPAGDNLEEVYENREQIEISRYYEKMPKSVLLAADEFMSGGTYYRVNEEKVYEAE